MTKPNRARARKTEPNTAGPSPRMQGNGQPPFTPPSAAMLAMSEMRRFRLRYWLFWHTFVVRMLDRQLDMLAMGAAGTASAQAVKPTYAGRA